MNVVKFDLFSKRGRLRQRNNKISKLQPYAYRTVSNTLPFEFPIPGTTDASTTLSHASFSISCSRSDLNDEDSTLVDSLSHITETCSFEKEADNEDAHCADDEETSLELGSIKTGTPPYEFGTFLDNFKSVRPTSHNIFYDEKFQWDIPDELVTSQTHKSSSVSGPEVDSQHSRDGQGNTSRATSAGKFNVQDAAQSFPIIRTPATGKTLKRNQSTFSRNKTPSHSANSSRGQTRSSSKSSKSPRGSGSGRITSDLDTGSFIIAVTEGRGHARGEVGIAAIDPCRPHLILSQISDSQRYSHTLTKINVFSFTEIIIPNTFIEGHSLSKLYADIREHFPGITLTSVQRRHFNETTGLDLINQYGSPESASVMVLLRDKFYALSAAAALIKYVEYTQNILFAPRSVKVEYQGTEDTMIIDMNTANKLELVVSRIRTQCDSGNTLFGVLKHCHTKGGLRLLRANILQPPCSKERIESRLDCVTELVRKPLVLFAVESAVTSFANVENLLSLCMHEPQQDGLRAAEFQLKYVLLLKSILEQLPNLATALENAGSAYFCENLGDVRYKIILNRILEAVSQNAKHAKGSVTAHLHACFAVKTGINSLLDVAKKTYCEVVQEIWDHVNQLREEYGLSLRMSFSAQRGFHIQYSPVPGENNFKPNAIPKQFILVQKVRSTYYFYTAQLVALDQRSQQVLNEVKLITNVILFELLNDIREHIGCLFNLCEYIAELDVIVSFAHVSSGQNYVRPNFGTSLNVTDSRHPILDVIHDGEIVPNDIIADIGRNCIILTGPNQSGKSVYIGQVALLQIMAQIGCYVPATSATFRLTDRIFSKLGCDDSIECNASTLIAEMRDVEYLRQNITPNSLVIIDELCKGTSVDEGTSLAFTICEEFLDTSAFIFVTTHYIFLTKLEEMYFNVVNYYFESELDESGDRMSLKFSYKMHPGVTKAEQYGLQIAERTCFPKDILSTAKDIAQKLLLERKPLPEVHRLSARYKIAMELKNELRAFEPDLSWDRIGPTVLRFKTMFLTLGPLDEYSENINCTEKEKASFSNSNISPHEDAVVEVDKNLFQCDITSCCKPSDVNKNIQSTSNASCTSKRVEEISSFDDEPMRNICGRRTSEYSERVNEAAMKIKKKYRKFALTKLHRKTFDKEVKEITPEKWFFSKDTFIKYQT